MPAFEPIRLTEKESEEKEAANLTLRGLRARTILAEGVVGDKMYRRIAERVILMQQDDEKKPITVLVNSPGGSADSGFAIFDLLRYMKPPVRTICNGLCASAGVLIFLAAKRDQRFSLPNSRYLLHQPSTQIMGPASDIEINANEILRLRESYNQIVAEETGKKVDQVTKDADRDFWLTAGQALEYGLVGKIVKSASEIEK